MLFVDDFGEAAVTTTKKTKRTKRLLIKKARANYYFE